MDPRERAFAHELSYGVTRLRGRLDHLIAPHVRRGLDSTDPTVLEILRLGAYQLLYMGSVPDYAAVSETVDQARAEVGTRPAGFVNAILRRVRDVGDGLEAFPAESTDPIGFLSSWGSHPRWLIERWCDRWSLEAVRRLVEVDNARPSTSLVPLDVMPAEAVDMLSEADIEATEVRGGTACVRLAERETVLRALSVVPSAIVQDPAANLVARYADVPSGTIVADLCAAPGGKALALSDRPASILAADRSESRLHIVRENARRTGRPLGLAVSDALRPPIREADVVMLDAPCTGTGTLSRHPDGRWRLSPDSIRAMAELQGRMLAAAADVVRPGGLLVYSTCTLEPEENEERIDAFLGAHGDFAIDATEAVPEQYRTANGALSVTPQDTGFDGAFAVRMRRSR